MLEPLTDFGKLHYAGLIGFLVTCLVLRNTLSGRHRNPRALPRPPGPKGLPLIGNLLDVPVHQPWLVYSKWQQIYGDMVYFEALGKSFLVLGSLRRATEVLEKKICSDRPSLVMLGELMGWENSFALQGHGPGWQRNRRTFEEFFHQRVISNYEAVQKREALNLIRRLLKTPDEFVAHIRHIFQATMMDIVYNIKVQENGDPYLERINAVRKAGAEAGVPGKFLVDLIPVLKYVPSWFPGAGFKRWAAHQKLALRQTFALPFEEVERRLKYEKSDDTSFMAASLLKRLPEDDILKREEDRTIAQNVAAVAVVAGLDTTHSSAQIFFLAMAMYPDVQNKAQLEIDRVVGSKRLPDFSDRDSLPYVNAIVKESLRWCQSAPLALPHKSTEDMEYDGYFIPKGTCLIGNSWSILHDPEEYSDPEEFRPERFLKGGQLNSEGRQPEAAAFGFGRRVCPAKHFAMNSLFTIAASVLAVYNITPLMDPQGRPVKLEAKFTSGISCFPLPFRCSIKPRNEEARSLIVEASEKQEK